MLNILANLPHRALARDPENEHKSTDATDDENADDDSTFDDDLTREEVPAMDGNMLQPVADAVMTPSPAGNSHRRAVAPQKIVKVR